MSNYLDELCQRHRRIDRLIVNCKAAERQEEMKQPKRIRLRIKDKIAAFQTLKCLPAD